MILIKSWFLYWMLPLKGNREQCDLGVMHFYLLSLHRYLIHWYYLRVISSEIFHEINAKLNQSSFLLISILSSCFFFFFLLIFEDCF